MKIRYTGDYELQKRGEDACFDLRAAKDVEMNPDKRKIIPTSLRIEIPPGYEGLIRPRSGCSANYFDVFLGTIDSGYRGEIGVVACNKAHHTMYINKGDRIAQLAIRPVPSVEFIHTTETLTESERGEGGFGSTGKE